MIWVNQSSWKTSCQTRTSKLSSRTEGNHEKRIHGASVDPSRQSLHGKTIHGVAMHFETSDGQQNKCGIILSCKILFGDLVMANGRYFVMKVECVRCKMKQKIHIALRPDAASERMETIQCIQCNLFFRIPVPDRIVRGPYPA
jgi:hypothetical protein